MGYKFKPNKSVAKRFRVSKTGKVKRHHSFTSHLMSSRSANKRRKLRGTEILFEGHARNMRKMMGVSGTRPNKIAHERALKAANRIEAAEGAETGPIVTGPSVTGPIVTAPIIEATAPAAKTPAKTAKKKSK